MDLLDKIDKMVIDDESGATTTGDVATNNAKGKIDVVGGKCPDGQVYDKLKKVCVPSTNETSVAAAVAGSGQTRVGGHLQGSMPDLDRKEPVKKKFDDKTKTNILGRDGLKFDKKSGAYIPSTWE